MPVYLGNAKTNSNKTRVFGDRWVAQILYDVFFKSANGSLIPACRLHSSSEVLWQMFAWCRIRGSFPLSDASTVFHLPAQHSTDAHCRFGYHASMACTPSGPSRTSLTKKEKNSWCQHENDISIPPEDDTFTRYFSSFARGIIETFLPLHERHADMLLSNTLALQKHDSHNEKCLWDPTGRCSRGPFLEFEIGFWPANSAASASISWWNVEFPSIITHSRSFYNLCRVKSMTKMGILVIALFVRTSSVAIAAPAQKKPAKATTKKWKKKRVLGFQPPSSLARPAAWKYLVNACTSFIP